jgi:chromosome segregation ATPase
MTGDREEVTAERFERLETKVDHIGHNVDLLGTRFDQVETRLGHAETRLDRVETRLGHVETRLDRVEARLEHVETRLDTVVVRLDKLEWRVGRVEVQLEDLREVVIEFENTIGGRLDALTREIAESRREFATKFQDHVLVLTNHDKRITVLERRARRRT